MTAGVVDHISWVQKVEPGFNPQNLAPFIYFSTARFYLLKFHKLSNQEPGVQRPELMWYISHSNHHRFPSVSDISLNPCCTVTMPFKTASFSSSYSTVYLCFVPNSSPVLHGFLWPMILPGLLTMLLMSSQRAFREEFTSLLADKKSTQTEQVS